MKAPEFDPDESAREHGEGHLIPPNVGPPSWIRLRPADGANAPLRNGAPVRSQPPNRWELNSPGSAATFETFTWSALETLAATEPPLQLVQGLIAVGERVLIYGFAGSGKSILTRELSLSVSLGIPFLGAFPTTKCRTGIIDEESNLARLGQQLTRIASGHGVDAVRDALPIFAVRQGARLDTPEGVRRILEWILEHKLGVVAMDTLVRMHRLSENDASEMARIDEATRELQASVPWPVTLIINHHAPKPRESGGNDAMTMARGSGDLLGSADVGLYLRPGRQRGQVVVKHSKSRWTEPVAPFLIRLDSTGDQLRVTYLGNEVRSSGLLDQATELALASLAEGIGGRVDLIKRAKAAGISARTMDEALAKLLEEGLASRSRQGRQAIYSLTEIGLVS